MVSTLDNTQAAMVSAAARWIPIAQQPPTQGARCLVIDRAQGIAYVRAYRPGDGWTHWHPLPVFERGEK